MKLKTFLAIIFWILFLAVLFQNTQVVTLKIIFWKVSMSRIILVPFLVAVGFIFGFFVGRKSWDW